MVLHCSAPGPCRAAQGRWFLQGRSLCLSSGWNTFTCSAGQEIIPGSFNVSGGAVAFIHSQTEDYIGHFTAVSTPATPFTSPSSPIQSLSARTHTIARPLTHSHLKHTHLTQRPIPERSYVTLTTMVQTQETHQQNLNLLLSHWSRRCGSIWDFQWVMVTTFPLLTKRPQFANSAETRWQIVLSFHWLRISVIVTLCC